MTYGRTPRTCPVCGGPRNHTCPPPGQPVVTVRSYDVPKLIAWIGSQPTSEIGPDQ